MNPEDEFEPNYDELDPSLTQPEEPVVTYAIDSEHYAEIIYRFNRVTEEFDAMMGLLSQAFAMSLEPLRKALEAVDPNNN